MSAQLKVVAAIAVLGLFGADAALAKKKVAVAEPAKAAVNPACGSDTLSKKLSKPIAEAQKLREAKDYNGMLAKVAEAEAAAPEAERTEYDKFWIHETRGIANAQLNQLGPAVTELEAAYNSPCMAEDPDERSKRVKLLMQLSYNDRNYDKAIEFGNKAWQPGGDPKVGIYLANAYYVKDDFENTRRVMSDVVATLEASGNTPDEQTYRILQSACIGLKDNSCVMDLVEKLVIHHPKPVYWDQLIDSMLRGNKSDNVALNVLRLADGADAMHESNLFIEMAQYSLAQGLPGEALYILDKGMSKGVFASAADKEHATHLSSDAKQAAALDKSTLDKQDASARAKPTGDSDVKLGAAYLSYGDNAKAIEALQRGIGKSGVKNPDEAGMLLGIAYFRSGNKAEATKAFQTVIKDPAMVRIAKLWQLKISGTATG